MESIVKNILDVKRTPYDTSVSNCGGSCGSGTACGNGGGSTSCNNGGGGPSK